MSVGNAMVHDDESGFLDAVAAAFLRRRLRSRRLRAAAARGLRVACPRTGDGLRLDFDYSATGLVDVPPGLAARVDELAAAPVPPSGAPHVPPLSIVVMAVGSRGDVQLCHRSWGLCHRSWRRPAPANGRLRHDHGAPGRGARRPRGVHVDYALVALRPVQRFTPQGEEGRDEAVRVLGLDRQRRQRERHSECEVIALGT